MSTLGSNNLTLTDWAKRLDPNGTIPDIAEMLSQDNGMLDDAVFQEGNLPTGHRVTVRTGLPTVAWRRLNAGTQPSKSTTAQVDVGCGMLEAWSEVDVDLANLNGNVAQFRLSEASAFMESMNQEMQSTLIYGSAGTAPEEFNGFATYCNAISGAANAENVISCSGSDSADQTSIYMVVWGANTVFLPFPKGSKAGLFHEDLGVQTIENANGVTGARMRVYQDRWQWKAGLCVKDWRYLVRICNIDVSNLTGESTPADIEKALIKAYHRIPSLSAGRAAIYMNRTVFQMLDIQRLNYVRSATISYETISGKLTPTFRGIPIRKTDAITNGENAVA